jgi:SAM-dependent methyltransferase
VAAEVERSGAPALFESTASYYSRYRRPYPNELFEILAERFELGPSTAVLDLGCGTGQLAIPLAARGVPVWGVDPDVEMLGEALRQEERMDVHGIRWLRGSDKELPSLHLPRLRLCTMGSSFHWMDRPEVLRVLDGFIDAGGGVAVVSGTASVWREQEDEPRWAAVTRELLVELLGPERRAGGGTYHHPAERHEAVLERSPFPRIESYRFEVPETLTTAEVIGLQLSTSYASPAQLGPHLDAFRTELASRLRALEPSGTFTILNPTEMLVATR